MTVPVDDRVLELFVDDTLVLMLALVTALVVVRTTTLDEVIAGAETEAKDVVGFEDVAAASAVDTVHLE